jgi:nucleoside-diphosphate-sugar epimerase
LVFTSTTSLMVSEALHGGRLDRAQWMTEGYGPLEPRNIYGITKLAAERLCALAHREQGLAVCVLRTSRFFPEDDDTHRRPSGPNIKANEFLNRRLTVEDAAEAHVAALAKAPEIGFGTFIVSAPPPFTPEDCEALVADAAAVVERHFPEAPALYARAGWVLPERIDRVYVPAAAEAALGFRARTDFASILEAIASGGQLPFVHDPSYVSPKERSGEKATC